jgi:hypothetical protein
MCLTGPAGAVVNVAVALSDDRPGAVERSGFEVIV